MFGSPEGHDDLFSRVITRNYPLRLGHPIINLTETSKDNLLLQQRCVEHSPAELACFLEVLDTNQAELSVTIWHIRRVHRKELAICRVFRES